MAFQSVPNTASAFVQGVTNGQPTSFLLYFYRAAGYSQTDLDNLSAAVDSWAGAELRPLLSTNYAYVGTEVRGLEDEEDLTSFNNTNAGAGGVAQDPLPNNCSFAIKRLSGFTGRSARGRVFLPGIPRTSINPADDNRFLQASVSLWIQLFLDILAYVAASGWIEVIVSRYTQGAKRPTGVVFAVADWANTDLVVDSQRRRLP